MSFLIGKGTVVSFQKHLLCHEGKDFCVFTADFIWKGLSLIVSETSASEG